MNNKTLEEHYFLARTIKGDIDEHIETLLEYSKKCDSILELGVRTCVSSWAFVQGLIDNGLDKKRLLCNDIVCHPNVDELRRVALEMGIDFEFVPKSDLMLDLGVEKFDLTFIDTWHVYGQLKRELSKFSASTQKYIIMHDTEVDRVHGESIRCGCDIANQSKQTDIPENEIRKGLQPAIDEFLAEHPEWVVDLVKTNNNGLTVLARKEKVVATQASKRYIL
jgi:hypothetical protein